MKNAYKLNDGHILEALDRIHVSIIYLEASLNDHPLLDSVTEFQTEIAKSIEILANLYQTVGQLDSITDLTEKYDLRDSFEIRE